MSGKKILDGYKRGGVIGAIGGIEPKDIKKAVKTAVAISEAVAVGGGAVVSTAENVKQGINHRRIEKALNAAKVKTDAVQDRIKLYRSILSTCVNEDHKRDWEFLLEDVFSGSPPPSLKEVRAKIGVPRLTPLDAASKEKREARAAKEAEARALHEKLAREHDEAVSRAREELARLKAAYEKGDQEAIEFFVRGVLKRSSYPEGMKPEFDVAFDPAEKTLVVDFVVPLASSLPTVSGYKYDESINEEIEVTMSQDESDELYEDVLYQFCLKGLYVAMSSSPTESVERVVFNGWVPAVDRKTGRYAYTCAMSCSVAREELESYNLSRVGSKDCFQHLHGVCEEPLVRLAPVAPLVQLNRRDARFIEPTGQ